MAEPILHLAKRAIKQPETLRAGEIKSLALWVEAAFKQKLREETRNHGLVIDAQNVEPLGLAALLHRTF